MMNTISINDSLDEKEISELKKELKNIKRNINYIKEYKRC